MNQNLKKKNNFFFLFINVSNIFPKDIYISL